MTKDEMAGWHHRLMNVSLSELRELAMDRESWRAAIHGVAKIWTPLSDWTELTELNQIFGWLNLVLNKRKDILSMAGENILISPVDQNECVCILSHWQQPHNDSKATFFVCYTFLILIMWFSLVISSHIFCCCLVLRSCPILLPPRGL